MKAYFFLIILCFLTTNQMTFAQKAQPNAELYYPAIQLSNALREAIFLDQNQKVLNCPILFNNSWDYPNGTSIALCDDAQLACLRYGLLIQRIKTATGKLLEELQKTLVLEKNEVTIRLRGCHLILEATVPIEKSLEEAAGYTDSVYGPAAM